MSTETDDWTDEDQAAMEAMQADKAPVEEETPAAPAEEAKAEETPAKSEEAPAAEKAVEEPKTDRPPEGYVPHQAMHAERTRRQALEQQLNELQAKFAEMEKASAPKDEMPDPVLEPQEYADWYKRKQDEQQDQFKQLQKQFAEQQQRDHLTRFTQQSEAQFRQQTPDYDDAVKHLTEARTKELAFWGADQQQIQQQIQRDIWEIIQNAAQTGRNPAEAAYQIAQARGYRKAEPAPAAPDVGAQVEAKAKAQAATESLSGAGGPANNGLPSAKDLAEMSEDDFAKLSDDDLRKVMGG